MEKNQNETSTVSFRFRERTPKEIRDDENALQIAEEVENTDDGYVIKDKIEPRIRS